MCFARLTLHLEETGLLNTRGRPEGRRQGAAHQHQERTTSAGIPPQLIQPPQGGPATPDEVVDNAWCGGWEEQNGKGEATVDPPIAQSGEHA